MHFENGITVKELKELLKDWPETNDLGDPSELWITTSEGYSNPVKTVTPLNRSDILIGP